MKSQSLLTHKRLAGGCFAALALSATSVFAGDVDSGKSLVLNDEEPALVKLTADIVLRYEYGSLDTLDDSHAGTLRNRFGLLSKEISGFQFFGEYEGTLAVDRGSYNAAGIHGDPSKTVIADPESHELNRAWVSYKGMGGDFFAKVGRQRIILDGARFIGNVGWRQNEQTYDAAAFTFKPSEDLEVYYSYINRVNRIFGSQSFAAGQSDFEGNSHIVNAKYKGLPFGTLTTYGYFLDLGNEAGDVQSNNTFGVSLAGPIMDSDLSYYLEYAYQTDAFDSPLDYATSYGHGSISSPLIAGFTGTVGVEYLGSDNGNAFRTPLATLHKFNGFADRFLATPAGGLTDMYATISTKLPLDIKAAVTYHYFADDGFGNGYGQEIDLVLAKSLGNGFTALAKGAHFVAEGGAPDLTRAIFQIQYKY